MCAEGAHVRMCVAGAMAQAQDTQHLVIASQYFSVRFSTRVPGPNISESHSKTRVLEYPLSTPLPHTNEY